MNNAKKGKIIANISEDDEKIIIEELLKLDALMKEGLKFMREKTDEYRKSSIPKSCPSEN